MSEKIYKNYVCVDVSKKHLDVYSRSSGEYFKVENNTSGFREIKKRLSRYQPCLLIVESTGGYESDLVEALQNTRVSCAVVNPRQVRDFAKGLGLLAKTDKIDSKVLAYFGEVVKPPEKAHRGEEAQSLSEKQQRRRQLIELITMEKNHYGMAKGR